MKKKSTKARARSLASRVADLADGLVGEPAFDPRRLKSLANVVEAALGDLAEASGTRLRRATRVVTREARDARKAVTGTGRAMGKALESGVKAAKASLARTSTTKKPTAKKARKKSAARRNASKKAAPKRR